MFRELKSAIIWTTIYRFRKKIVLILLLLFLILFIEFFYQDFAQYLQATKKVEMLGRLFFIKWTIYLLLFGTIIWIFSSMFKKPKRRQSLKKIDLSKMSKSEISELAQKIIEQKRS